MDKVISQLAGLGIAGLVLAFVISTTGLAGAAALMTALPGIGGPLGIVLDGGTSVFVILIATSKAIEKFGIGAIAKGIVSNFLNQGRSEEDIISDIKSFPIISNDLKLKIIDFVNNR